MSRTAIKLQLIAAALWLSACDYEIDEGTYADVRIGSTKQEVVETLRSKGVPNVLMKVDNSMRATKDDIAQLPEILKQDGICLNTQKGTFSFGFAADSTLSYLSRASETAEAFPEVRIGMSRDEFSRVAQGATEAGSIIFNCLAGVDWVKISGGISNVLETLSRFNKWAYWEPNSYSHADLIFADGKLERIVYYWRLFEE